jgi:AhpD family alkylhydroperoxidase
MDPLAYDQPSISVWNDRVAELVAIGAAVGSNCEPCLRYHCGAAAELGVPPADMRRAVDLAQSVKETPARHIREMADRLLARVEPADGGVPGPQPAQPCCGGAALPAPTGTGTSGRGCCC